MLLTVITLFDLCSFIFRNCFNKQRNKYVEKHLLVFSKLSSRDHKVFKDFTNKFLRPDVILVFRILSNNVNAMVVSELIKNMWDSFRNNYESTKAISVDDINDDDDNQNDYISDDNDNIPRFPINSNSNQHQNALRNELKARTNANNFPRNNNRSDDSNLTRVTNEVPGSSV